MVHIARYIHIIIPFFVYYIKFHYSAEQKKTSTSSSSKSSSKAASSNNKQVGSTAKVSRKHVLKSSSKHVFSSPDLQCSFKGHTDLITSGAISANGKGLMTASEGSYLF